MLAKRMQELAENNNDCRWTQRPATVEKVATAKLPTEIGNFMIAGYRSLTSDEEFVVLFKGELNADVPTLVRIHSQCLTGDVFGSIKCDCGPQLHKAMEMIEAEGRGDDMPVGYPLVVDVLAVDSGGRPELHASWEWPVAVFEEDEVPALAELWFEALRGVVRAAGSARGV